MAALLVTACGRKALGIQDRNGDLAPRPDTGAIEVTRLGSAIDRYEKQPTRARAADVNAALAKLGGEIAKLANHITRTTGTERAQAEQKFIRLRCCRDIEQVRFTDVQTGIARKQAAYAVEIGGAILGTAAKKADQDVRKVVSD